MKVVERYGAKREVAVSEAVASTINDCAYGYEGQLERANARAEKCAEFLGALTEMLVNKNLLTAEQLDSLLSYKFIVED